MRPGVGRLASGLTVQALHLPATRACTCAIAVEAGSRTEGAAENGVAHFVEHLLLRGGRSYPTSRDVRVAAQRIGASLNGYVTHDLVLLHVTTRVEHALSAVDLLTDIVGQPAFDPRIAEIERDVVLDEIAQRREEPHVIADELLDAALFGAHPLGRPVTGSTETVRELTAADGLGFHARRYLPQQTIVILAGDVSRMPADTELAVLLDRLKGEPHEDRLEPAPRRQPDRLVATSSSSRSLIRLGFPLQLEVKDPSNRAALHVLASLLGSPLASRLSDDLRERRGMCYSTTASLRLAADVAVLIVSAEVASTRSREAIDALHENVERLATDPPSEEEVERARQYTTGRRILALEQSRAVAQYAARQWVLYGAPADSEEAVTSIDRVTADHVAAIIEAVPTEFALACVGPDKDGWASRQPGSHRASPTAPR